MIDKKTKTSIINFIRLSFRYAPVCQDILKLSIHPTVKGPKGGKRYKCKICKNGFALNEVQIDHIEKIIPNGTKQIEMSLDEYSNRLYCDVSNLQVLCKPCHKIKTNKERHPGKRVP